MSIGIIREIDEGQDLNNKRLSSHGAPIHDWNVTRMNYELMLKDLSYRVKEPNPDERYFMNLLRQRQPPTKKNLRAVISNEVFKDMMILYTCKSILYLYRGIHDEIDAYLESDDVKDFDHLP